MLASCRRTATAAAASAATRRQLRQLGALARSMPRRTLYDNICQTIGRTPIVKVNRMVPEGRELYVKLEYFNPLGSTKDRLAAAIIEDAERKGLLKPGDTIVEATSGNTGIALAMACAQRGYNFVATMADSFSLERRKVMRALGAKVILTPMELGGQGMVEKAEELSKKHGWLLARQFEADANWMYHASTTGPEILQDFVQRRLDYWVTGFGTGGTFLGVSRALKMARPDVKVVLAEPEVAPLITSGIPQPRREVLGMPGAPDGRHEAWSPHPIQGWTPDFIPKLAEDGIKENLADEVVLVNSQEAIRTALKLAKLEGMFTGISGGGSVAAAIDVCKRAPEGSVVLAMIADSAERYLSTPLYAEIDSEMDEVEVGISRSTSRAEQ